jgi:hypothetical protein
VELAVEDWEALGKLRESVKWTLRHRRNLAKRGLTSVSVSRAATRVIKELSG